MWCRWSLAAYEIIHFLFASLLRNQSKFAIRLTSFCFDDEKAFMPKQEWPKSNFIPRERVFCLFIFYRLSDVIKWIWYWNSSLFFIFFFLFQIRYGRRSFGRSMETRGNSIHNRDRVTLSVLNLEFGPRLSESETKKKTNCVMCAHIDWRTNGRVHKKFAARSTTRNEMIKYWSLRMHTAPKRTSDK